MTQNISIASWNINSVRARLDIVERFCKEISPDILCLQETKVIDGLFPEGLFRQFGYRHMMVNGQPMYHGVAIVSKLPLLNRRVEDWQANGEARHISAEIGTEATKGVRLDNVYIPAGGEVPDAEQNSKFGQKLAFLGRMTEWSETVDCPTILTGDFNVAPLENDVWSHKQLTNVVSHTQTEIDLLAKLKAAGNWTDIAREFVDPSKKLYTWWSYRAQDWETSDKGRRLDHMWVTPQLKDKAKSHVVHKTCRSWGKPSDHAPIVTEFAF